MGGGRCGIWGSVVVNAAGTWQELVKGVAEEGRGSVRGCRRHCSLRVKREMERWTSGDWKAVPRALTLSPPLTHFPVVNSTCSDFNHGSALHIAASNLCLGAAKCLLEHGANPALRVLPPWPSPVTFLFLPSQSLSSQQASAEDGSGAGPLAFLEALIPHWPSWTLDLVLQEPIFCVYPSKAPFLGLGSWP